MNIFLKCLLVAGMFHIVGGFCYNEYKVYAANNANEYEVKTYTETVMPGDTFDGLAEKYYVAKNEGVCWQEWRYNQRQLNKEVVSQRHIYPGDKLVFAVKVLVRK